MDVIVLVVIITALVFDFTNGFHDTANAMATSIATGALKPRVAVAISGVLNLVGAFLSVTVAKTISSGLVDDTKITPVVIFGGLIGAILWNLLTWLFGLPSSSSYALVGGLIGATWVAAGGDAVHFASVVSKVLVPMVLAPVVAGVVALVGTYLAYRITARADRDAVGRGFKAGQVISASMVSLAHGTNDAQKTMGVITLTLITAGTLRAGSAPPFWVILIGGAGYRAGHLPGWLADHPNARQAGHRDRDTAGLRRRDSQHRCHPRVRANSDSRSRPPWWSRARSSEWGPAVGWLRCGGAWPARCCSPGS